MSYTSSITSPVPSPFTPPSSMESHTMSDGGTIDGSADPPKAEFFSLQTLKVVIVPILCGLLYGYNIGFVPVFYQMRLTATDCSAFNGGPKACENVAFADCRWFTNSSSGGGYCGWTEVTCRVLYAPSASLAGDSVRYQCEKDERCRWSFASSECTNPVGYDALHQAIFAGAMTAGAAVGSIFGGRIVTTLGTRLSLVVAATVVVGCSVMIHISIATDEYWVMIPARVVTGLCIGITGVATSLYVDQNAPTELKRTIGSTYMVCICGGVFVTTVFGLCLGQTVGVHANTDPQLMLRLQGVQMVATASAVSVILLGVFIEETKVQFIGSRVDTEAVGLKLDPNEYSYRQMIPRLFLGFILCCSGQLTGLNALTNYAPTIFGNLGLAPLMGTFILMTVALIGGTVGIRLSYYFSPRFLFISGTFCCASMCLFLCGIPVYPGIASETTKNVVAIVGALLFMLFFQCGIGPYFYVFTQEIFPPSFRPKGASVTICVMFLTNLLVTVSYPIAVVALSGGHSGDPTKGQAIAFIFFGVVGFLSFFVELLYLFPWDSKR